MLSQLGASGLFAGKEKISKEAVDEIANASQMMSEDGSARSIIIERSVGLKDLIENATQLDAVVKAELLVSIFFKNNILHDGAVVISGNKIFRARSSSQAFGQRQREEPNGRSAPGTARE
jgi:diadenylate cyclase